MPIMTTSLQAELLKLAGASAAAAASALNAASLAGGAFASSMYKASPQRPVNVPTFGAQPGQALSIDVVGTSEGIFVSRSLLSDQGVSPDQTGISSDGRRLSLGVTVENGQISIVGLNAILGPRSSEMRSAGRCWDDSSRNASAAALSAQPSMEEISSLKPEQLMPF